MLRKFVACAVIAFVSLAGTSFSQDKKPSDEMKNFSYAMGMNTANSLKNMTDKQDLDFDFDAFMKGIKDTYNGTKTEMNQEEAGQVIQQVMMRIQQKQQQKMQAAGEKNSTAGAVFLEQNRKKKNIKTTASGLQYEVLKEGKGAKPALEDVVTVNYSGKLLDGTEFDSSYKRNEPATFPLNRVIKGWQEGLQLMTVGSKYKLYIPAELGYGAQGAGNVIGPNQTLLFEVELLSIKGK